MITKIICVVVGIAAAYVVYSLLTLLFAKMFGNPDS
jgi:uncharacterized membrane protein YuzA (DUF378 family)